MRGLAAPTWRMTTLLLAIALAFVLLGGLVSAKDGGPGDLQDRIIKLEALTDQHSQQIAALQAALDAETAARIAAIWNREVRETLTTTDTEPRSAARVSKYSMSATLRFARSS